MKFMRWKIIAISALVLPVLTACQSAPSVLGPMNDIERSLDLSYNSSELDPKGICGTLLTAKVYRAKSQALSISRTSDIKKLNSNLELLLSRMKSVNLEKSQSADGIKSLLNSLRKIETKSENMKLYDEAAASWKNLMYLPEESYCYDWNKSLDSTPTPTSKSVSVVPGSECDIADEISDDGKYICSWHGTGVWTRIKDSGSNPNEGQIAPPTVKSTGHFETVCQTIELPNPNYDGRPTDSRGHIQWPTIRTQQCSQVWVPN
jgi:hypothetical protein